METDKRPRILLQPKTFDWILIGLGWLFLIGFWAMSLYYYFDLPDIIPIHYNGKGVADGFGSKKSLFSLPGMATLLFVGLMVLNRYPHLFNYPVEITPENAAFQYTKATRLIRVLALSIVMVFTWIGYRTIQHALENSEGLGKGFLLVFMAMIFLPILYYLVKSFRSKNESS